MSDLLPSWLESANAPGCPFPLNNLPYGVFSAAGDTPRCGIAIGDRVLDIPALARAGAIEFDPGLFVEPAWNAFMQAGPESWRKLRARLQDLLGANGDPRLRDDKALVETVLVPLDSVKLHAPFRVTEFTDFFASRHHAQNVGALFRDPQNALPPNWLHIPIGYNGRASSVVASGTAIHRPWGQLKAPDADAPVFAPSRRFDIELELGAVIGSPLGGPSSVQEADDAIFGYTLLNDWSARDIQFWEYQPLGPFQAKATATSIGEWIVPKAALEPFRVDAPAREKPLLEYLKEPGPMLYDIDLDIYLRGADGEETRISRTNYRHMYYSAAQQIAHHTACGCPMRIGDLTGSGTISGPTDDSLGCLIEMTKGGREPLVLKDGQPRTFLEDGDTVRLTGAAKRNGIAIGFGNCVGTLLAPLQEPYAR
ncbi:fumarylacetoacetase [Mesorhizobium sp. Z1-4]|uniref:fumarylacetoacetase n=1 Tax=Mesorhizobium sp. Z1-4 TaxID=2448478 RepID=UPI000FD9DC30|nr:fumarylacetoacetase [Mesorhizobium sp. Z1-4]